MAPKVTPSFFYGSAIATVVGLVLGLSLHGAWEEHDGGPRILFSSAAAEELARPAGDEPIDTYVAPDPAYADAATLYDGYLPPTPLPVTRLAPDRFAAEPASAGDVRREDADVLADADVTVSPDEAPPIPVRYSALEQADPTP